MLTEIVKMDTQTLRAKRQQRLTRTKSLGSTLAQGESSPETPERRTSTAPDKLKQRRGSLKRKLTRTDSTAIINVYSDNMAVDFSMKRTNSSTNILKTKPALSPGPNITVGSPDFKDYDSGKRGSLETVAEDLAKLRVSKSYVETAETEKGPFPKGIFLSCPDLGETSDTSNSIKLPTSCSTDVNLCSGSSIVSGKSSSFEIPPLGSHQAAPSRLTVPSIFTTSFTRSKSPPIDKRLHDIKLLHDNSIIPHRHSAPDLSPEDKPATGERRPMSASSKPPLAKSLSDNPPRRSESAKERSGADQYSLPRERLLQNYRSEPVVSNVLDFLLIGNLESAYNARLRCKLGVKSIIDLSNIPPDEVPASKKNEVPCTCTTRVHTTPTVLRLNVCEADVIDIQSVFPKINKFIEGAREKDKKSLVVCYTGTSLSVLAVIQYLMTQRAMSFRRAYSQVMKGRSDIELNYTYFQLLQSIERQMHASSVTLEDSGDTNRQSDAETLLPKEAWSDC